jgi:hypothetical protein
MIVEFTDLAKEGLQTPQPLWMRKDKLPEWAERTKQDWVDKGQPARQKMLEALTEQKPPPKPKPAAAAPSAADSGEKASAAKVSAAKAAVAKAAAVNASAAKESAATSATIDPDAPNDPNAPNDPDAPNAAEKTEEGAE